uniref:Srp40 C-terminal domain-containing protein n=1 Tax=Oryza rufipogon TaxID=4529 RepID=A0A0E0RJZ3_ORYRU
MLFLPRQLALSAAAAAAAMAKEESRKEKKAKTKAASSAAAVPDARRAAVVAAVAAFLESSGFPRALAALQSEANLEAGSWRSSPVSLEELVSGFLEDSSNYAPGASINGSIEHEKTAAVVAEDAGKKKKKKGSDTKVSEAENKVAEPSAVEKPSENADVETKEKKQKKKSKKQENDEDVEARLEKAESAIINKFETVDTLKEDSKNGLVDVAPVEKGKKKKKGKSTPETSDKVDTGSTDAGADCAKGKGDAAEMEKDNNEKKSKKKLKKSKENVEVVENKEVAGKDSAPKSNDENNSGMETEKGENGMPPSDNVVVGKKRKLEEVEGSNLPAKEDNTASQKLSNGSSEDDGAKPNKRQKKSSEPKTVNAFQRVKLEDVKFADDRLQDNSYWAKGGADSGYGAKAQEVLGQVRGRGFRHEKTKKKRGTYRGGQIDLQTHSIKFNDSDDE